MKQSGLSRVFPDARRDNRGSFSPVSKFFQNYFKDIGVIGAHGRKAVFHAFRLRFTDELRQNHPDEWIRPLLGHSGTNTTSGYGASATFSMEKRYEMICSMKYGVVDWEALTL